MPDQYFNQNEACDLANKHVATSDKGFRYQFSKLDVISLLNEAARKAVEQYKLSQSK